jgi:LacI family transcriptional regulator
VAKRATLKDIAQRSGVSSSTVSLVLRSRPGIPAETRQRVLEAAETVGYDGQHLRSNRSQPALSQIAVILRAHEEDRLQANPFYSPVLSGIESACREHSIRLLYTTILVNKDNCPIEAPRLLLEEPAEGLLVVGVYLEEALATALKARPFPVVLVDAYAAEPYDAVVAQNFEGAYRAVSYLIRKGHRHIGLVGGYPGAFPSLRERRRGYVQALRDHRIESQYIADCSMCSGGEEAVAATIRLLLQHEQITALFGCNDLMTIRALQGAQAVSRRVPDDLSLVGFDDIEAAHLVVPGLTTMRVDKAGMGRMAVRMLLQRLESPGLPPVVSALATRLIERQSVRDLGEPTGGELAGGNAAARPERG